MKCLQTHVKKINNLRYFLSYHDQTCMKCFLTVSDHANKTKLLPILASLKVLFPKSCPDALGDSTDYLELSVGISFPRPWYLYQACFPSVLPGQFSSPAVLVVSKCSHNQQPDWPPATTHASLIHTFTRVASRTPPQLYGHKCTYGAIPRKSDSATPTRHVELAQCRHTANQMASCNISCQKLSMTCYTKIQSRRIDDESAMFQWGI